VSNFGEDRSSSFGGEQVNRNSKLALSGSQSEFYPTLVACSSPTINLGEPLKGKIGSTQLVLVHYQICEVRGNV